MKRGPLTLALAGLALVLAVPAIAAGPSGDSIRLAQAQPGDQITRPGPGMGMGPGPGMGMMRQQGGQDDGAGRDRRQQHMAKMCETADAHHAATLAFAETRLKLTEAQKTGWSKVVAAATAAHQSMTTLMCGDLKDKPAPTSLPDRLARDEQLAQARLSHLQTLRPALDEFYKTLTPEQQKIADTLPLGTHGPGRGQGGHRMQHGW
ncbi:MAG: Spy/CpxP family protein refolding chaperone [Rhodospirillaceae bacterium]